ncbi:MAG TPA: hypothetical protein VD866_04180 [Urbifossiella sp.]|nr:hypothetical protein [Urbifossiella sp.]
MTRAIPGSLVLVTAITAATTSAQPTLAPARKLDIAKHGCEYVHRMEFSPDGSVLAVAGSGASGRQGQVLQLWSVADGRHIRTLHADANEDFALSPDGKTLAIPNNRAGEVVLWDVPGGKELRRLNHPDVRGVDFSPVGNVLATYTWKVDADCNRDQILIWDTATGKQLYATTSRPEIHITFAVDGRLLFWGYDRRLRCWDPVTRKERPPVIIPPGHGRVSHPVAERQRSAGLGQ